MSGSNPRLPPGLDSNMKPKSGVKAKNINEFLWKLLRTAKPPNNS